MPRISFGIDTPLTPDEVIAAATDFSDRRPAVWPTLDPAVFAVHERGEQWAEVTEGGGPLPGMWARERYDWSRPGVVTAEIADSSIFQPGGRWELHVKAATNGSRVTVVWDRRPRGPRGLLVTLMVVTVGRGPMAGDLRRALDAWAALDERSA